jgi:putative transferase (TIGR04331 family)
MDILESLELVRDSKGEIPLGQWCLNSFKDNRKTLLQDFWTNQRKVEIYNRSLSFYKNFLKELVPILNKYHKIDKDEKYYNIVIGKWLFVFSMQVNSRIEELKEASKKLGKFSINILDEKSHRIPLEYLDLIEHIQTDIYNLQLYTQILENMKLDFSSSNIFFKVEKQKLTFHNKVSKIKKLENSFWIIINSVFRPKIVITNGYFFYKPLKKKLELFFRSRGKISHNDMNREYSIDIDKIDYSFRNYKPKNSSDYETFKYVTFKNFPLLFLEMFSEIRDIALREKKIDAIYSSMGNTFNYLYKFYVAEYSKNLKSLYHQHGGSFGIDEVSVGEDYEIDISDIFYTWGWKSHKNTIPLPHPKLDVPILNNNKSNSILFVTNIYPKYMHLFKTQANDPDSFINSYTKEQVHILKKIELPVVLRKKGSNNLFEDDILNSGGLSFEMDNLSIPFYKSVQKHKVIFFDHLMTSALETLAWNIPTIIYVNREKNLFRKEAQEYLNILEKVKIINYDVDCAIKHVNKIAENPEVWWNSDEVQTARQKFVHQYARTSENWVEEWIREFDKILDSEK